MFKHIIPIALTFLILFVTANSNGAVETPSEGTQQADSRDLDRIIRFHGLTAPLPDNWTSEEPANRLRLSQAVVPGAEASENGELVIYYFGDSRGNLDDHIDRWQSQFSGPDGTTVEPVMTKTSIENMPATLVEFHGNYARNLGMGPSTETKEDQTMLALIIEGDDGMVFIQLHGPRQTVSQNRADFDAMVKGIRAEDSTRKNAD